MKKISAVTAFACLCLLRETVYAQSISTVVGWHDGNGFPVSVAKVYPASLGCVGDRELVIGDERVWGLRRAGILPGGLMESIQSQGTPYNGVAVAPNGTIYASDPWRQVVWRISTSGESVVYAGTRDNGGFFGDGTQATLAMLQSPSGLALDTDGTLYIADTSNMRVRKVSPTGIITTYAGGNFSCPDTACNGPATSARLSMPRGVGLDAVGNLYITETLGQRVRVVNKSTGIISTFAGNGNYGLSGDGGQATSASLTKPNDVAIGPSGEVYIADTGNHAVRMVSGGIITTVAGTGQAGAGADGPAKTSKLDSPKSVEWCNGKLWVAEGGSSIRVRAIDMPSVPTPVATSTPVVVATSTHTRTQTSTHTPVNTHTFTPSPTRTLTSTPTCGCCDRCG